MSADANVVEVTLESDLKNVEVADEISRRVSVTAGFGEDEQQQIELAVHESLINAIKHGNRNDSSKSVSVRYVIYGDRLEVCIRDQGEGFDVSRVADPLAEENLLNISGRGIFLIRAFMDDLQVDNLAGGGAEVTLVKRRNSTGKFTQGGTEREHEGHSTSS
jgi:serine/threonine-protein kinase RsbW